MPRRSCWLVVALALCAAPALAEEIKAVASFSILADFVREVGGDRVKLTTLVGPDGDAHVYEPTPLDAKATAGARLIFINGLGLEGWLPRLIEASGSKAPVIEASFGIETLKPEEEGHDHEDEAGEAHGHGDVDPHGWQNVANAVIYVKNIREALCAADASGCPSYTTNADGYIASLEGLDREIRDLVAKIPPERRRVITSHDAFGYFEHAYGIDFLAPEGVSTDSEASAADVARLIEQVRHDKAAALFVENITDPRLIEQIARETGIAPGGALYSDALSDARGPASTYLDMMRHNARTIVGAINQGS